MVEKRGRRRVEGFNVLVWICLKPSTTKETKIQCSLNYHPAIATSNISKYYYSMRVRFTLWLVTEVTPTVDVVTP